MTSLPPLEDPPTGILVVFSPGTVAWIGRALKTIYSGLGTLGAQQDLATAATIQRLDAILAALGPLTLSVEGLMATVAELQSALDANTAATEAASTAINTEIDQLRAAIANLSTATPPTQAQIDQLAASTAKLQAATAALGADDPAPSS